MAPKRQAIVGDGASTVLDPKKPKLAANHHQRPGYVVDLMPLPPPIQIPPGLINENDNQIEGRRRAVIPAIDDKDTQDAMITSLNEDNQVAIKVCDADELDLVPPSSQHPDNPICVPGEDESTILHPPIQVPQEAIAIPDDHAFGAVIPTTQHHHKFVCPTIEDDDSENESDEMPPLATTRQDAIIIPPDTEDAQNEPHDMPIPSPHRHEIMCVTLFDDDIDDVHEAELLDHLRLHLPSQTPPSPSKLAGAIR